MKKNNKITNFWSRFLNLILKRNEVSFFISFRYLYSHQKKIFSVSFINILSILGIALGIAALIISLSIMNGFQKNITDRLFASNTHINLILSDESQTNENYKTIEHDILKIDEVEAISPFIIGNGMLKRGKHNLPVVLKGVTENELKITKIKDFMKIGDFISENNIQKNGIVVGKKLLQDLGGYIGDELIFISPAIDNFSFPFLPTIHKFVIIGIFETGIYDFDSKFVYINLYFSQYIFDAAGTIHGFGIKLKDPYKFDEVIYEIQNNLKISAFYQTWFDLNKGLFVALKMEKIVMSIVLFLIIVVASFGIISSLLILTIEKTNDIGILKTIGFRKKDIIKIFVYQSFFMSVIGIVLGIILSTITIYFLKNFDFIKIPAEVYFTSKIPVNFKFIESLYVVIGTILICLISSIIPAIKASRVDIVEAIREN
ncbi:MAG: ABC transporter permease [Elusimicrobiota bacterium]|jgi:lipoprotein-releasing system permease protein|nr:ABC transporter permease [Elusimicrobiota bacterium]